MSRHSTVHPVPESVLDPLRRSLRARPAPAGHSRRFRNSWRPLAIVGALLLAGQLVAATLEQLSALPPKETGDGALEPATPAASPLHHSSAARPSAEPEPAAERAAPVRPS